MEKLYVPIAYHPGEDIAEELEARGRSQSNFAHLIGKTNTEVSQLITGKRNITPDWAVRIAAAFGTSENVRLGLQQMYDTYELYKSGKANTIRETIQTRVQELAFA